MPTDAPRPPIWARPEPSARAPRFSRERIAAAALEIADADGIEAVSMRNVAARLGAGTMTLYNYVETKDELFALMDDALMAEAVVPDGELPAGWREATAVIARRTWAVLTRHPWAISLRQGPALGPNAMYHFEQSLAALSGTGLSVAARFDVLATVDAYVFGSALRAADARGGAETERADVEALIAYGMQQLATGRFPNAADLLGGRDPRDADVAGPPTDPAGVAAQFERGLQAVLDGIAGWM
ncbi:TetR/AcrR family transcriptional regulator C-terminal domain-containing protein [Dactylosporangium sp. CA-139066]|uniref:TetR/AcrR family transcriptional regulator C-terminal domain-containing protein n=1 Tax=Dactylosporangium sp. CA-139066 TaxID=3239930 RepID=UPI003D920414